MTWVTPLTSMPREARSVATSTRALPRLKLSSAFWRAFCDLLPWIASEETPRSSSASATRLAPRLVRVKTMRSEEHTSELQSRQYLVCRLLLEKKKDTCNASHAALVTCAVSYH